MRFVIYTVCSDRDFEIFNYIAVFDTLEEAIALKQRLKDTGFYFDGKLFVGDDDALYEADMYTWHDHKNWRVEHYPGLQEILDEYNYFR